MQIRCGRRFSRTAPTTVSPSSSSACSERIGTEHLAATNSDRTCSGACGLVRTRARPLCRVGQKSDSRKPRLGQSPVDAGDQCDDRWGVSGPTVTTSLTGSTSATTGSSSRSSTASRPRSQESSRALNHVDCSIGLSVDARAAMVRSRRSYAERVRSDANKGSIGIDHPADRPGPSNTRARVSHAVAGAPSSV